MQTFKTKWWKEIKIKSFMTRKTEREYNEIMTKNADINMKTWEINWIKTKDLYKAQDFLVLEMTDLKDLNEVDSLDSWDYQSVFALIEEIQKKQIPSLKA